MNWVDYDMNSHLPIEKQMKSLMLEFEKKYGAKGHDLDFSKERMPLGDIKYKSDFTLKMFYDYVNQRKSSHRRPR